MTPLRRGFPRLARLAAPSTPIVPLAAGLAISLAAAWAAPSFADVPAHPDAYALETVVLESADKPSDLLGGLRVYIEGVRGINYSVFGLSPDKRFFTRLPIGARGGLGGALREKPFEGVGVWLAFSAYNATDDEYWAMVADGTGFKPNAMVIVSDDGTQSWFAGDALDRLRREARTADIVSYSIGVPSGERVAVYFRLDGKAPFGPSLAFWSRKALLERETAIAGLVGAMVGAALMVCLGYLLTLAAAQTVRRGAKRPSPLVAAVGYLYAVFAGASAFLGFEGGGLSAMLAGVGFLRFAASMAFAVLAMAAEAIVAWANAEKPARAGAMLYRIAFAALVIAPALASLAPLLSFFPLAGITVHVIATATREALTLSRLSRQDADEIRRLSERLDSETRGGRDLMTATAAALRGPLYGLIGMLDELEAATEAFPSFSKQASESLSLVRAEAGRLDVLVSNILDYAGLRAAGQVVEDLDLGSLARQAAGLARVALAGRGLRLDVDVPILELRGDARTVHRLIYTAIGRAARTPGVRAISVSALSDESDVAVIVEDDGREPLPGARAGELSEDIDMVALSRIARVVGGSAGYERSGLSNLHTIRLPRDTNAWGETGFHGEATARGDTGAPSRKFASPAVCDLEALLFEPKPPQTGHVLIAGNEPVVLLAMKRRLEAESWEVAVTVSAEQALDLALGGGPCDIVILDSAFPGMSGFDFCASVRKVKSIEALPIIVLVEAGRPEEIERAFAAGASDYIARPPSGTELAARVRTHVELSMSVRRELAQAARMADLDKYRTLAMLSAGVAHEINTPNNAVLRNVPVLKEIWAALDVVVDRLEREEGGFSVGGFGSEDLKREIPDMLNDLYMGAQDIKRIVEGLKDYARAPTEDETFAPVDVNESVKYATRLLKHSITLATDRLELSLDPNLPKVHADRLKLTQVIVNVVENAVQALPERSRAVRILTRKVEAEGGSRAYAVVEVADEGIGIDDATMAKVFDPFFTTKRDRGGTGLGLAVSRGIVNDFGGTISLSSALGGGTKVTIRIPFAESERGADGP